MFVWSVRIGTNARNPNLTFKESFNYHYPDTCAVLPIHRCHILKKYEIMILESNNVCESR